LISRELKNCVVVADKCSSDPCHNSQGPIHITRNNITLLWYTFIIPYHPYAGTYNFSTLPTHKNRSSNQHCPFIFFSILVLQYPCWWGWRRCYCWLLQCCFNGGAGRRWGRQ